MAKKQKKRNLKKVKTKSQRKASKTKISKKSLKSKNVEQLLFKRLRLIFHRIKLSLARLYRKLTRKTKTFLKYLKRPSFQQKFRKVSVFALLIFISFGTIFYLYILRDLPTPSALKSTRTPLTTIVRDRNGKVLYRMYKNANRVKLSWEQIPELAKNATIAIEDAKFYHHKGISVKAIIRAFLHNLKQENINLYQGGSTITQQLIKNRLLGSKKTYRRKIREILLSLWTEFRFSKEEILTMYLNEVGYGGPAYGIEAASQMYFGVSVKDLTLAQAAFLAGLPAAPTTFSPFGANPELSFQRQIQVIDRMLKLAMITKQQAEVAKNEKIVFAPQRIDIKAPHFVMFVKNQLVEKFGEVDAVEGGLDVVTTLDLDIQRKAEEIVKNQISKIKDAYNIGNAAVLVTNPTNGEILAMVGSVDYFDIDNKGYVNVTNMPRQPGSAIKPVNYAYAFDHGYSPNSTIVDAPVVYVAPGATEKYAPVNYDGKFHGIVTLRAALANSYNIPAVKLLNKTGIQNMIETGRKMGIKSWNNLPPIGLSLTLGGAEVTMLDMARVYGTIANLGIRKELKTIKEITDSNGINLTTRFYEQNKDDSLVEEVKAEENEQVISALSAYWLTDILSDTIARLPAFGYYSKLTVPNHKVAVKTGTSNNFRDNWTIGFTPDYLTAAWVGNNDGSFMNRRLVSGVTGAAPIWNEVMSNLLADAEPKEFPRPEGLIPVKICAVNGLLTCQYCPREKIEYFTTDKIPTKKCFFRSPAECDTAKQQAEGKSDEERKKLLSGCLNINQPTPANN